MTLDFKKLVAIVFATSVVFGFTACGKVVSAEMHDKNPETIAEESEADSKAEAGKTTEVRNNQVTAVTVASTTPEVTTTMVTTATTSKTTTTTVKTQNAPTVQSTTTKQAKTRTTSTKTKETYIPLDKLQISFDMDVSKPTGLSKEDFVKLINNLPYDYYGYFKRNAEVFWEECNKQNVNEIFACGIAAWESGWGQVAGWGCNNYFGISGGNYATEADGVKGLVSLLANSYLNKNGGCYNGTTITGVSYCYCEPYDWPNGVYGCMQMIANSK